MSTTNNKPLKSTTLKEIVITPKNVGDKILKGKCKEKGEAKKEYQRNIVQGNSAYMMEQASDNIFKIAIGKIDKDEEVKLKIYYIDKFEITDNTIKILILHHLFYIFFYIFYNMLIFFSIFL